MQKGFTLLEIAIVMLIISLCVGGIMYGRALLHVADIRGVETEIAKYSTAITLFKSKMGSLPGDLRNASSYWPTAINGDGDGIIDYNGGNMAEEYYAWNHLSQANLVQGRYITDFSIPTSVLNSGYYRVSYQSDIYTTNAHMISLNRMNPVWNRANSAILSPKEVSALDLKSDDGLADSGNIMGFNEEAIPGCVTNDYTVGSGSYVSPTSDDIKCKIFFVLEN